MGDPRIELDYNVLAYVQKTVFVYYLWQSVSELASLITGLLTPVFCRPFISPPLAGLGTKPESGDFSSSTETCTYHEAQIKVYRYLRTGQF
jgi:hypothetical protein